MNPLVNGLNRRAAVALIGSAPYLARAARPGMSTTWKIGQSTALTGTLADLGLAIHHGAAIAFAEINKRGGVHGRPIDLVTLDDGYDAKRALANVEGFLEDKNLFSLFNCIGTPAVAAMLPKVIQSGVPFFAPFTGGQVARPKDVRNVFNVRASYAEEAEQLVRHLSTIGIRRIGIAFQNNAFGKEIVDGASIAIKARGLPAAQTAPVESDGTGAEAAASMMADAQIEALVVGLAGQPAIRFIKAMRAAKRGLSLYTASVLGAAGTIRALGADGVGIAVSQVVPSPQSPTLPIVRDFRSAWKASGTSLELSHIGLEGYINARAFAAVLARAGASATPQSFIDAAWSMKRQDLGGFEIAFTEPGRGASKFVELTMITREGRLVR